MRVIATLLSVILLLFCVSCTSVGPEQYALETEAQNPAIDVPVTTADTEETDELIRLFPNREIIVSEQDFLDMSSFVGCWQHGSLFAAEYHNHYIFHPNYTYIYFASFMDGMERDRVTYGYWWVKDKQLVLEPIAKLIWVGGELVPASGSTATDYELAGDIKTKLKYLYPRETDTIDFGEVCYRKETDEFRAKHQISYYVRDIGGVDYWKFAEMCSDYYPEKIWEVESILNRKAYNNKVCGYDIYTDD